MEDRSLDEFLSTDDDEGDGSEPSEAGDVDPATATSVWDPRGDECVACGATVRRRWRGEAGLVCAECKGW